MSERLRSLEGLAQVAKEYTDAYDFWQILSANKADILEVEAAEQQANEALQRLRAVVKEFNEAEEVGDI